jgi:hypothetical protein
LCQAVCIIKPEEANKQDENIDEPVEASRGEWWSNRLYGFAFGTRRREILFDLGV